MIEKKVQRFIEEKHLLTPGQKALVALSGGADSVALLLILLRLGYKCEAAHCNFHLRGEESERDQRFVEELAERLKVKLHVTHFPTKDYAANHGISIEMAARDLRYAWFERLRQERGADIIAVAHHQGDNVETFLLNLIRGAGINGLRGIPTANGRIVRPLLCVSRDEILDYLSAVGQDYVTDSTNLQDEYKRNKIRLNILPMLGEINPSVSEAISETAGRLSEVARVYQEAMKEACRRVRIDERRFSVPALLGETSPQSVLYELLYPLGFNPSQIKDVFRCLGGQSGRLFYTDDKVLLYNRGELIWKSKSEPEPAASLHTSVLDNSGFVRPSDPFTACLDADAVCGNLTLRKWRSGDRFIPFGMTGFKKVRNYLRDKKYSLFQKESQYVVCAGDEIVWLVGERTDNRFRVRPETRRILLLRVEFQL